MVPIDQAMEALELLSVFVLQPSESDVDDKLAFSDKLRVFVETIFLGWSFPIKRMPSQECNEDDI